MAYLDLNRCFEVALIFFAAMLASVSRILYGIIGAGDYPPRDPELCSLWYQRLRWSVAGEASAVMLFVMTAEAIVILRGYSGPTGVIIGATAGVLGYPFIAAIVKRRATKQFDLAEK